MNLRKLAISVLAWGGIFVVGVLLFNFVIMPMLVHQRGSVIVPDLARLSEAQAVKSLERVSLNLRVDRSEHDSEVPDGYVISQSPRPNETIKEGRTVEVVLSLGARTERVPDVAGKSLRQTRVILERRSLRIGRVARVITNGDPGEAVIATNPPVGTELTEGTAVNLVVAVGGSKRSFLMPDLEGQDLLFIRDKLQDMGFRVSGVRYETRDGVFPNTVIGQAPAAGAMIREGDSIELVAASSE